MSSTKKSIAIAIAMAVTAAMLAGCAAQTYEGGRFAQAGQASVAPDRSISFKREAGFKQPQNFRLSPEDVAAKFGHLCKAKKGCAYFADSRAYYLVADYGQPEAKSGSISQVACPVVDAASGSLLRIC
jgi:predicted small secreted protein